MDAWVSSLGVLPYARGSLPTKLQTQEEYAVSQGRHDSYVTKPFTQVGNGM